MGLTIHLLTNTLTTPFVCVHTRLKSDVQPCCAFLVLQLQQPSAQHYKVLDFKHMTHGLVTGHNKE